MQSLAGQSPTNSVFPILNSSYIKDSGHYHHNRHHHWDNDAVAYVLLPVVVYTGILMICGTIGNSIVCFIYFVKWQNRTVKYFIGCLSLYDLITCVLCMPIEMAMLRNPETLDNPYLCKFLRFVRALTSLGSGFMLVVIAFDRYWRICRHTHTQIDVPLAKRLCIITGIAGTLLSWPCFLIFGSPNHDNILIAETSCSTDKHIERTIYPTIYYSVVFLMFFGISVCLVTFYSLIGSRLCQMPALGSKKRKGSTTVVESIGTSSQDDNSEVYRRERSNSTYKRDANSASKIASMNRRMSAVFDIRLKIGNRESLRRSSRFIRKRKTTITLFLITLVQWMSFLPYIALLICRSVVSDFLLNMNTSEQVAFNIGILSHFLSSGLNPFVYSCFSKDFRKECKKTWGQLILFYSPKAKLQRKS